MKSVTTHFILDKLLEERLVVGAILLSIIILITSGATPEQAGSQESVFPVQEEFNQMMQLELGSSVSAALFRGLMLIFLTLAVSGIVLNIQGVAGRNLRYFHPADPPEVRWGIWPVLKIAAYFFCIVLILQRLESVFFSIFGIFQAGIYYQLMISNASFQFLLMIFLVICFLTKYRYSKQFSPPGAVSILSPGSIVVDTPREKQSSPMELMGISPAGWGISLRQALRGYILFFPSLIVLMVISLLATKIIGLPYQPHPLVQPLLEAGESSLLWPLFAVAILIGPLAEELFFRGLFFPALKSKMSVSAAVISSAALFATLHLNWAGWLPIFGLGILLAYSYQKTGDLLVPIFIHAIHNSLFLTFTVLLFEIKKL
ncbi:MAG TPA: CPBP family intramembrane metalloprotease [Proteobacteria bacterium]|nr:CPBP family intramembrane metalloprotease [Pseudomonadota bacterium]